MSVLIFALLGGIVGAALLSELGGFLFGAIIGALAGFLAELAGRVRLLERRLEARHAAEVRAGPEPASPGPAAASARRERPPQPMSPPAPSPAAHGESPAAAEAVARPVDERPRVAAAAGAAAPAAAVRRSAPRAAAPSALDALLRRVAQWFTTGNVPVKVGVVLSLFGVGFLVKEGIDRQWLVLPLEARLALVALFGVALLVVGWRLRARQRVYALSVQGGGVGVLYLTIFASYSLYSLLPSALAFALLVVVTAAAVVLAVLQDARSLAVLGILGGFLAPVLASSGSDNHVGLFSYYALLDVAIVAIAWFKAWRVLNVLGFVFTFGIGTLWGIDGYQPEDYATTQPFLALFTLIYLVIPVLFATRGPPKLHGFVDGTLMFGTPIVAFALQSRLVADTEYGLALSAVALAAFYVGMATLLYRSRSESLRVLIESQLALGVAFITVAVPLALDARWTSAAWALQGAALVWLGFRQQRKLALAAGVALQALSGAAYVMQSPVTAEWPIVNGYCLGALLLAFAGFFSARLLDPQRERAEVSPPLPRPFALLLAIALLVSSGGWWLYAGVTEIDRQLPTASGLAASLAFYGVTAVIAAFVAARIDWPRLDWLGLTLWPFAALGAFSALVEQAHPAEDFGWLAWPIVGASMLYYLRAREARFPVLRGALHATGFWLGAGLVAWQAHWLVEQVAGGAWPQAAALAIVAALVLATLRATTAVAWPFAAHPRTYAHAACGAVVAGLVIATLLINIESPGDPTPLPYLPLANPLELASAFVLLVVLRWLAVLGDRESGHALTLRGAVAAAGAWFLVTMAVARAVHHFEGVPYDLDSLAASTTFQSALSIVWGVAGLAAMVAGARSRNRTVWIVGAALMAVVVAKLFLVDLGNTGTLARVISFLGVGVLLLVVGYFAPAPPRAELAVGTADG
jgi:uncharacterized membrane protein